MNSKQIELNWSLINLDKLRITYLYEDFNGFYSLYITSHYRTIILYRNDIKCFGDNANTEITNLFSKVFDIALNEFEYKEDSYCISIKLSEEIFKRVSEKIKSMNLKRCYIFNRHPIAFNIVPYDEYLTSTYFNISIKGIFYNDCLTTHLQMQQRHNSYSSAMVILEDI